LPLPDALHNELEYGRRSLRASDEMIVDRFVAGEGRHGARANDR
jgi:hypothetical protein